MDVGQFGGYGPAADGVHVPGARAQGHRFALDDRFGSDGPHSVAIKVTYHDIGKGKWTLVYTKPGGATGRRTVQCKNSKKALTTTFHLNDACFGAKGEAFDFHIQATGADAIISFVRVIKTKPSS